MNYIRPKGTSMNKVLAMKTINLLLSDFKYLYKRQTTAIDKINLELKMDSSSHTLQTTLEFNDNWVDVLSFISPPPLLDDTYLQQTLRVVNYINHNVKSWGRFYIDIPYADIAYSLRIEYSVLNTIPRRCNKELEAAVDLWVDVFIPLLNVCKGKASFTEAKGYLDLIWS